LDCKTRFEQSAGAFVSKIVKMKVHYAKSAQALVKAVLVDLLA